MLERMNALYLDGFTIATKNVGPLECPEIGKLGPKGKGFYKLRALLWVFAFEEIKGFLGVWKYATRVEEGPA